MEDTDLLVAIAVTLKDNKEAMDNLMILLEDENPTKEQIILKYVELTKNQ